MFYSKSHSNSFLSHRAQPGRENPVSSPPEEHVPGASGQPEDSDSNGSWVSHIGYGLGVAAVFAPFFIPGLPDAVLWIVYFGMAVALLIGVSIWGIIRSIRSAIHTRRVERREIKAERG